MFNFKFIYFLFIILFFLISKNSFAHKLKIISLAPNLTEIIYALGLGENLVGNTTQCDYPKEAKDIYKVGDYINPNIEKILVTHPDFALVTEGNPRSLLNNLKLHKIKIIEVNPQSADELPISIDVIAQELGVTEAGYKLSNLIRHEIIKLKKLERKNQKFFLALQFDPIFSISNQTWLGNLFTLAGYKNVVGTSKIKYPIVTQEYLIKNKPDIFFVGTLNHLTKKESERIQKLKVQKIFGISATKSIRVITLPKDVLVRAGPRIIDGIHFIESLSP